MYVNYNCLSVKLELLISSLLIIFKQQQKTKIIFNQNKILVNLFNQRLVQKY